jgi:hypothetical protein
MERFSIMVNNSGCDYFIVSLLYRSPGFIKFVFFAVYPAFRCRGAGDSLPRWDVVVRGTLGGESRKAMTSVLDALQQAEKAGSKALNTFPALVQDIWSAMFKFSPEFRKPQEIVIQPQVQRDPDGKDAPDAAVQGTESTHKAR